MRGEAHPLLSTSKFWVNTLSVIEGKGPADTSSNTGSFGGNETQVRRLSSRRKWTSVGVFHTMMASGIEWDIVIGDTGPAVGSMFDPTVGVGSNGNPWGVVGFSCWFLVDNNWLVVVGNSLVVGDSLLVLVSNSVVVGGSWLVVGSNSVVVGGSWLVVGSNSVVVGGSWRVVGAGAVAENKFWGTSRN